MTAVLDPAIVEPRVRTEPIKAPVAVVPDLSSPVASPVVERRGRLSRREFEHEYSLPRRPVILTDATKHWKARHWTPQNLKARVGHRQIQYRDGHAPILFGDLTEQIEASHEHAPAPYARNVHVFRDLPELADDVRPRIPYCVPDWKSSRLLPKHWVFENGLEELFFGGQGAKFPSLHIDYWGMDAFISQIWGEKDVLVFAPEDTPYLYPTAENPLVCSIKDFDRPDLQKFPLYAKATPIRFRLSSGETLFCPNGWWHTTSMPGVSITMVTASWSRAGWPALIAQYRHFRQGKSRWKTEVMSAYLKLAGSMLTQRDRWMLGL